MFYGIYFSAVAILPLRRAATAADAPGNGLRQSSAQRLKYQISLIIPLFITYPIFIKTILKNRISESELAVDVLEN